MKVDMNEAQPMPIRARLRVERTHVRSGLTLVLEPPLRTVEQKIATSSLSSREEDVSRILSVRAGERVRKGQGVPA